MSARWRSRRGGSDGLHPFATSFSLGSERSPKGSLADVIAVRADVLADIRASREVTTVVS
jgi:hypothetical protein